jgi:hypothetical protein
MAFRHIVGIVAALSFSSHLWADELELNPQHPDQYTVVKNDTLWDISAKFLKSPWLWPKLWHGNPQIKNPDLIYPGDVLQFSMVNGKPSLRLAKRGVREVKLHPGVRKEDMPDEIKTIPADAIVQFLDSSQVLESDDLGKNPYVVDFFASEHLIIGAGDRVYVRSILDPKTLDYTLYRKGQPYLSPETGEVLGYEATYIASGSLEKEGDPATLAITKSSQEIRLGDRVMPNSEKLTALNFLPKAPDKDIKGSILSVLNGVTQIGKFNVVVIDKGSADGIKIGDVLTISHRGKIVQDRFKEEDETVLVKLPDEASGTLMVFRPFKRVSYALVMQASRAIHVLDRVQSPEQQ